MTEISLCDGFKSEIIMLDRKVNIIVSTEKLIYEALNEIIIKDL